MYSVTVGSQFKSKALRHFKLLKIDTTFPVCLDHGGVSTENGKTHFVQTRIVLMISRKGLEFIIWILWFHQSMQHVD